MSYPIPNYDFKKALSYPCHYHAPELLSDFQKLALDPDSPLFRDAPWSEDFQDIEGENKAKPRFRTRFKAVWTTTGIYFLALLEGEEVWAYVETHDGVIFQDNDFEIFIDPDDDSCAYIEFEINAKNVVWDLLLTRPYRNRGLALNSFEIKGLQTRTQVFYREDGRARDWRCLVYIPFRSIEEVCQGRFKLPNSSQRFRINFSRVHWNTEIKDGHYQKLRASDGKILPEENWVWSPQGLINMHYPEMWGCFIFYDQEGNPIGDPLFPNQSDLERFLLRQIWYEAQKIYASEGQFRLSLEDLQGKDWILPLDPAAVELHADGEHLLIALKGQSSTWLEIDREGEIRHRA
ncbi:MAG: carbohydrate-binding family 9-like protein [Eubacteriales bacterium]|nr:carbohydrate-binding family 9-like protein [Eubacteriales bacterium]